MKFEKLLIKNFRNFENCEVRLTNKNLIFGMNDVGKSNMIHALRMLFDYKVRNGEIFDTDFHNKNTTANIQISCFFKIEDSDDDNDSKKVIAKTKEAIDNIDDIFQIKLNICKNNISNEYVSEMLWGTEDNLLEIRNIGVNKNLIDDLFHCIYIPSHNETYNNFKNFQKELLSQHDSDISDEDIRSEINSSFSDINSSISRLSTVRSMESSINTHLEAFDETYKVKLASKHSFGDFHSHLDFFIHDSDSSSDNPSLFPNAGDGRKRKVMYAMINYLLNHSKDIERKIPIVLIEEPENHLFLSSQIELSQTVFNEGFNKYLFLVTHSPQLFYKISNESNLIRLFKKDGSITAKSQTTIVNESYNSTKNILVESLAHCLFVERVLLVEGPSEKVLFDWILDNIKLSTSLKSKIYVLNVVGVDFKRYLDILLNLGIEVILKTDNDVKKNRNTTHSAIGFNRCVEAFNLKKDESEASMIKMESSNLSKEEIKFNINEDAISLEQFYSKNIYLSTIDLEHDLAVALNLENEIGTSFVDDLQEKKYHNMWSFISGSYDEVFSEAVTIHLKAMENEIPERIFEDDNFKCLKVLTHEQ